MRSAQRVRYAEAIDRVIAHLEKQDEQMPTLAEAAGVAAMSEYHFHRVFRLMTGETLGEAVRRIRLAKALPELGRSQTVAQGMAASGYGSQQSFARALRAQADTTARAVRADGGEMDRLAEKLRSPAVADGAPLRIEVASVEPFRLLAIRNVGDYAELNASYHRLFELVLAQVASDDVAGLYGIPYDDPRHVLAADCRFDCALAVGEAGSADSELVERRVAGGEYLRLRHHGDYDLLHALIDEAYVAAIDIFDRPIRDDALFIHYHDDPEQVPQAELRSDVYLPLG